LRVAFGVVDSAARGDL